MSNDKAKAARKKVIERHGEALKRLAEYDKAPTSAGYDNTSKSETVLTPALLQKLKNSLRGGYTISIPYNTLELLVAHIGALELTLGKASAVLSRPEADREAVIAEIAKLVSPY